MADNRLPRLRAARGAPKRVWVFTAVVAAVAAVVAAGVVRIEPIAAPVRIRWWLLAPMVYLSELTVVHLRFRREAHSFSMSELPLVVGLFFAAPADLLGTGFGIFHLVSGVAMLLASLIAGVLWSAYGASATFVAGAGLAATASVGLVTLRPRA